MIPPSRKERERHEREERILEAARAILLEEGFSALSMDRIATAVEWSKGTVYQHFHSKEDVLAALCLRSHERMTEFFARAVTFKGRPRERILAIGVAEDLFVRLAPSHFRADQIILLGAAHAKVGSERLQGIDHLEMRCFEMVCGVVRDGIAAGDLELRPGISPEVITMGLWSLSFGAHFIGDVLGRFVRAGFEGAVFEGIVQNASAMLDGLGWRPLTHELDWHAVEARVRSEVFPEESRALGRGI